MLTAYTEKVKKLFKGDKGTRTLVLLGLAGLVCILLSSWLPDKEDKAVSSEGKQEKGAVSAEEADAYTASLEERLENMLMKIDGVGNCSVMITVSGSVSYSYAKDSQQHVDAESQEISREHVILDEDAGDAALIEYAENPEVTGIIVACEGGDHNVVREQVYDAVGAVLDVPSNRICVTKLIKESGENK